MVDRVKLNLEVKKHQGDYYAKEDELETSNPANLILYVLRKCDGALRDADEDFKRMIREMNEAWDDE